MRAMAQFYAVEMMDGRLLLMEVTLKDTPAGPCAY